MTSISLLFKDVIVVVNFVNSDVLNKYLVNFDNFCRKNSHLRSDQYGQSVVRRQITLHKLAATEQMR